MLWQHSRLACPKSINACCFQVSINARDSCLDNPAAEAAAAEDEKDEKDDEEEEDDDEEEDDEEEDKAERCDL